MIGDAVGVSMSGPGIDGYVDAVEIGRGGFAVVYRARRSALGGTPYLVMEYVQGGHRPSRAGHLLLPRSRRIPPVITF